MSDYDALGKQIAGLKRMEAETRSVAAMLTAQSNKGEEGETRAQKEAQSLPLRLRKEC